MKPAYTIMGLEFFQTCPACPEQYDVVWPSKEPRMVGYVRLRFANLTVSAPDCEGKDLIDTHLPGHGQNSGQFHDEAERSFWLRIAAEVIVGETITEIGANGGSFGLPWSPSVAGMLRSEAERAGKGQVHEETLACGVLPDDPLPGERRRR